MFLFKIIVNFLVLRREQCLLKNNFISWLLLLSLIFLPDAILCFSGRAFMNIHIIITAVVSIFCLFASFGVLVFRLLVGTAIFIFQITQLNYAYVTGFAIDPILISKIFAERGDLLDNIGAVWVIDAIYIQLFIAFIVFNIFKRKCFYVSVFGMLIVIGGIFWLFYDAATKEFKSVYTSPTRQTIRNSAVSYAFFLTHIKDIRKLDDKLVEKAYKKYEVNKITDKTPRVIVIFMGESTNAKDMSVINPEVRQTTPLLENFAKNNEDHFMYMTAMSGAVGTLASHALFFNIIREPGNIKCLKTIEHNLFKMAKENGYKTHWLSTQSIINPDYASVFADDMETQEKNALTYERKRDDFLVDAFKKMDLSSGKHLVVINPRTAHIPYYRNYEHRKKEFKRYTDNKTRFLQETAAYHNSIVYLDWILNELLTIAIRKNVDYFFITSDHGDFIRENEGGWHGFGMGHNILELGITYVPFMIYSKAPNKNLFDELKSKKLITHYEISKFIATLLGFNVVNPNEEPGKFFIHDSRITGDYRVLSYKIEDGVATALPVLSAQGYMQDLVKKNEKNINKKEKKDLNKNTNNIVKERVNEHTKDNTKKNIKKQ